MDDLRDYTSKSTRLSLPPPLRFVSYVFFKKCPNYAWKSNFNCFTPLSQKKSKSEGKTNGNQLINWQKSPTTTNKANSAHRQKKVKSRKKKKYYQPRNSIFRSLSYGLGRVPSKFCNLTVSQAAAAQRRRRAKRPRRSPPVRGSGRNPY